jgi:NAD(P)-dependent dehydrogenase (short-subunit alcohol dehydrogenase family)
MSHPTARPSWAQHTDLTDRTILVVGGSGGVGEGVVRTLIDDGARVVATGREQARLQGLSERIDSPKLSVAMLDALDVDLDEQIAELAKQTGLFDGVVISIASTINQQRKPLLSLSDAEWEAQRLVPDLTSIFRLYRATVPHLQRSGALILLNGYSADLPIPGNGGNSIAAAAAKALTRSISAELAQRGPRVYGVVMGVVRTRARQFAGIDNRGWIDGTEIGAHVAELVAGTSPLNGLDLHYFVEKSLGPRAVPPEQ